MTHAEKEIRNEAMRLYKAEGHTNQEVAEKFNLTETTANLICKGIAPQKSNKPPKNKGVLKSEEEVARDIEQRQGGFLYAGNYTGADGSVNLKCKKCGAIITRSMITVRHNNIRCRECDRIAKEKQKANQSLHKWFDGLVADIHREEKRIAKQERKQSRVHPCLVCGKQTDRPKYCSQECYKTTQNYISGSHDRLNKSNIIDTDIILKRLYKKEWGVCYLCGESCDWEDFTITKGGVFIAGDMYPSIDHIKPLAKGGLHSWDNVRLAHRICNTKKSDRVGIV